MPKLRRSFRPRRALRLQRQVAGAGSGSTERRTTGNRKPARARTHARRIGARYEVCGECGLEWNVSKDLALPWYGYRCPRCRSKWKRIERSNT
nr:MAG TPA: DNA-directed RNA polymerase subunit [Caudoviricetes sp.]